MKIILATNNKNKLCEVREIRSEERRVGKECM